MTQNNSSSGSEKLLSDSTIEKTIESGDYVLVHYTRYDFFASASWSFKGAGYVESIETLLGRPYRYKVRVEDRVVHLPPKEVTLYAKQLRL